MRKFYPMLLLTIACHTAVAQQEDSVTEAEIAREYEAYYAYIDSMEQYLDYRTGEIVIGNGLAEISLPQGYRYLDPDGTTHIVTDTWGNPPMSTLGMIIPPDINPYSINGWGVVLSYEPEGHVDDEDVSSIDFTSLLEDMQARVSEENEIRIEEGFDTYKLKGWAEDPHYDGDNHVLFWALDLHFGMEADDYPGTLNYNARVLGREGVLVLNAVSGMEQLPEVRRYMSAIMPAVAFTSGNRYEDYNPSRDKLAAYGIGGLVAGDLSDGEGTSTLLHAFLVSSWKLWLLVLAGVCGLIWQRFFRIRTSDEPGA